MREEQQQPTDFFKRAAQLLGADVEGNLGVDPDQPESIELRAQLAQTPEVRAKLEAAGIGVTQVSRKEMRRRAAVRRRAARKQAAQPPRMFVDGGEERERRRLDRNKRKARKRKRGAR
jgi:hypothetical protein